MKSLKITPSVTDRLTSEILKSKQKDDREKLKQLKAELADKVYNSVYTPDLLEKMRELYEINRGFFFMGKSMQCAFAGKHSGELEFAGDEKRLMAANVGGFSGGIRCNHPSKFSKEGDCWILFDADHEFTKNFEVIAKSELRLYEEAIQLSKEIRAVIDSVNTTKKLIEIWPECEPFLQIIFPDENKPATNLAPVISTLNNKLGLPAKQI